MTLNAFKKKEKKERKMNNIYFRFDNNYSTRFFYKQYFFSTQPHCCLTFSWSELQMLLRCWLTLSWRKPLSYRNQCIDLQSKSMDWFLYDNSPRHKRVKRYYNANITRSQLKVSQPLLSPPSTPIKRRKSQTSRLWR